MDLTVQIITKNNEDSIKKTIDSVKSLNATIVINDLGSTDKTIAIAKSLGSNIRNYKNNRSEIRNKLCSEFNSQWHLVLEPYEFLIGDLNPIVENKKNICYMPILVDDNLQKDIRLWNNHLNLKFKNPVFEILNCESDDEINTMIYSKPTKIDYTKEINEWKKQEPTNVVPYYYESIMALNKGDIDTFINKAEHFLFLEQKKNSIPYVMNRYYYALVHLNKKQYKTVLQNINLCLTVNPLMAEFWCLIGDVYYHLINDFDKAIDFYENAIILGSRRKKTSKWPMHISKYKKYPELMIESCNKIKNNVSYYLKTI